MNMSAPPPAATSVCHLVKMSVERLLDDVDFRSGFARVTASSDLHEGAGLAAARTVGVPEGDFAGERARGRASAGLAAGLAPGSPERGSVAAAVLPRTARGSRPPPHAAAKMAAPAEQSRRARSLLSSSWSSFSSIEPSAVGLVGRRCRPVGPGPALRCRDSALVCATYVAPGEPSRRSPPGPQSRPPAHLLPPARHRPGRAADDEPGLEPDGAREARSRRSTTDSSRRTASSPLRRIGWWTVVSGGSVCWRGRCRRSRRR